MVKQANTYKNSSIDDQSDHHRDSCKRLRLSSNASSGIAKCSSQKMPSAASYGISALSAFDGSKQYSNHEKPLDGDQLQQTTPDRS